MSLRMRVMKAKDHKNWASPNPKGINEMTELLFKMMFQDILLGLMKYVPDHFKRKEMYNEAVRNNPWTLEHVPDHFKTQEMCIKAVEVFSGLLWSVPGHFKMQDICDKEVGKVPWSLSVLPIGLLRKGK